MCLTFVRKNYLLTYLLIYLYCCSYERSTKYIICFILPVIEIIAQFSVVIFRIQNFGRKNLGRTMAGLPSKYTP